MVTFSNLHYCLWVNVSYAVMPCLIPWFHFVLFLSPVKFILFFSSVIDKFEALMSEFTSIKGLTATSTLLICYTLAHGFIRLNCNSCIKQVRKCILAKLSICKLIESNYVFFFSYLLYMYVFVKVYTNFWFNQYFS